MCLPQKKTLRGISLVFSVNSFNGHFVYRDLICVGIPERNVECTVATDAFSQVHHLPECNMYTSRKADSEFPISPENIWNEQHRDPEITKIFRQRTNPLKRNSIQSLKTSYTTSLTCQMVKSSTVLSFLVVLYPPSWCLQNI